MEFYHLSEIKMIRTVEVPPWEVVTCQSELDNTAENQRTTEMILLLIYLGKRASKVRADDLPSEVSVTWLAATILLGIKKKVLVF